MKGEGCIHGKTDHSKQDFHSSARWKCLVTLFACVISGQPATEICLLFVHQSVMPLDGEGRGCYVRGGVGHRNTPPDELRDHRCVQAKSSLGTGRSPEAEPVVHVCKVQLYCSVHPTVIGGGKHLDGPGGITFSTSTKNP